MSPLPLIILFGILSTFLIKSRKKLFYLSLTSLLLLTSYWLYSFHGINNNRLEENSNQIVFWNIANQKHIERSFFKKHIISKKPDLIAFVEAKNISVSDLKYLTKLLPEYDIRILKGYMFIAVKGEILSTQFKYLETNSKFNHIVFKNNNQQYSVVLADVSANPFQSRQYDLESVLNHSNNYKADIVLGDFNTPFESIHFEAYKKAYSSFHSVSRGFTATWPLGLPLLELDQIWTGKTLQPILLNKYYHTSSDHALLVADYSLL